LIENILKKQETTWPIETKLIMNVYSVVFFGADRKFNVPAFAKNVFWLADI